MTHFTCSVIRLNEPGNWKPWKLTLVIDGRPREVSHHASSTEAWSILAALLTRYAETDRLS